MRITNEGWRPDYISVDIETTHASRYVGEIIEIAFVEGDFLGRTGASFHRVLEADGAVWSDWSQENLFEQYQKNLTDRFDLVRKPKQAYEELILWLSERKMEKLRFAGKNAGGFDIPYIQEGLVTFGLKLEDAGQIDHRILDTGLLAFRPGVDEWIPGTGQLYCRLFGTSLVPTHGAYEDAKDNISIIKELFQDDPHKSLLEESSSDLDDLVDQAIIASIDGDVVILTEVGQIPELRQLIFSHEIVYRDVERVEDLSFYFPGGRRLDICEASTYSFGSCKKTTYFRALKPLFSE